MDLINIFIMFIGFISAMSRFKFLGTPKFEPVAAELEGRTLPLCYAIILYLGLYHLSLFRSH